MKPGLFRKLYTGFGICAGCGKRRALRKVGETWTCRRCNGE